MKKLMLRFAQTMILSACWICNQLSELQRTNEQLSLKKMILPQGWLSVLYCIKMQYMRETSLRSTRHSVLFFPNVVKVHCPPSADRSEYLPSTTRSAPQLNLGSEFCCHVVLLKAMFSTTQKAFNQYKKS